MNGTKIESVQCVKDLGVTVASSLKFSQQCKEAGGKANTMLGFINRNFSFKNKDVTLPPCISLDRPIDYTIIYVRLLLEYAVQYWAPHQGKDITKLEAVQ